MTEQQEGRLIERIESIDKKVSRIDNTIHGNGQLGLKTQVDRNTQTIGSLRKFFWILVTAVVGIVTTVLAL